MDHKVIMQGLIVRIAVSVFGLATIAMLLLALYNDNGYFAVHGQSLKLKALESDIQSIEKELESIKEENELLRQEDSTTIERYARDLDFAKRNETILTISDESAPDSAPAEDGETRN